MNQNFLRSTAFKVFIIFFTGFVAYALILQAPFKTFDDDFSIINNELIKNFANLGKIFTTSYFSDQAYFRPLVYFTYMLEYHAFGLTSAGYYLTNILLHSALAVIIFFLLRYFFTVESLAPFCAALLFAFHPIHWEAVTNISGRAILLSTFFSFASFYYFLRFVKDRRKYCLGASVIIFILALLSKESAVTLPILLCAYLLVILNERLSKKIISLKITLPYWLLLGIYFLIRKSLGITEIYQWRNFNEAALGFLTFLKSVIIFLRLFIFPSDLHFDRATAVFTSFSDPKLILTLVFFSVLIFLALKLRKRIPPVIFFFIFWFFIELFPVSQIFAAIGVQPGYIASSEHFLYSASVGIFVLLVLAVERLINQIRTLKILAPRIITFIIIIVFLSLFLVTVKQNIYSLNELSMFEQTLKYEPQNIRIRYSLSVYFIRRNLFAQAEEQLRTLLKYDPANAGFRISLGKALCDQGRFQEGLAEYEKIKNAGKFDGLLKENIRVTKEIMLK